MPFIIIEYFNINVLEPTDPLTQRCQDILVSFGLSWSIDSPTRVTATTSTAIDNVIINITNKSVYVINTAISGHFGQEVVIHGLIVNFITNK